MKAKRQKLPNGVRIITTPMPTLQSVTLTVWVGVGSRHEVSKINGISHFLEHMVFKGSLKRPSAFEISQAVDRIGGEFNASTSKEWTNFYIKARAEKLDTAFDVLSDMVLNPVLKPEDIEKEKGVILEEIAMYEDTPMYRVNDVFEQLIFKNHSLGQDIAGVAKTVKAIKLKDFKSYIKTHYYAENIVLTVAGKVKEGEVIELADKYFGHLKTKASLKLKSKVFSTKQKKPQLTLVNKKNEQAHLILGFLGHPRGHKDRFVESVLVSILGGGMSSRLFLEVREKRGLAYSVRSSLEHYKDTGYLETYAGVDPKKAGEAVQVILDQCYGLVKGKYPISEDELKKAKEYIKGHLALSLEDTKAINYFLGEEEVVLGKLRSLEEVFRGIDLVTIKDCLRVAKKLFTKERLNLVILGPFKDEKVFKKLIA